MNEREAAGLAALLAFESAARGLASERFSWKRFSIDGRLGRGNVLGVGGRYHGTLSEEGWSSLIDLFGSAARRSPTSKAAFDVALLSLYEAFVSDLRSARYDGRIAVDDDGELPFEATLLLRKLGLITLMRTSNASVPELIDRHVEGRIEAAGSKVQALQLGHLGD